MDIAGGPNQDPNSGIRTWSNMRLNTLQGESPAQTRTGKPRPEFRTGLELTNLECTSDKGS